jgi:predicted DNA-binding transcriptional regulator AlpA
MRSGSEFEPRQLLKLEQVAQLSGTSVSGAKSFIKRNKIPQYRVGRAVRYSWDDILVAMRVKEPKNGDHQVGHGDLKITLPVGGDK